MLNNGGSPGLWVLVPLSCQSDLPNKKYRAKESTTQLASSHKGHIRGLAWGLRLFLTRGISMERKKHGVITVSCHKNHFPLWDAKMLPFYHWKETPMTQTPKWTNSNWNWSKGLKHHSLEKNSFNSNPRNFINHNNNLNDKHFNI